MKTLIIFWKTGVEEHIPINGIDLDPSGNFWYYDTDPNDRIAVFMDDYHWARVV